ncbi:sodium:solute symporter family transporter [Geoglobus acetivorans]|uniref:Sodium/proline symporter n=1 Tax=Geoglobus acetivorans TaxID=565033 RepID=A0ABZ3H038_GEOAI|nr:sodium/proline symporter [Geoglobus acetivorans]
MSDPVTVAVVIGYFVLTFAIGVYAVKRVKTAEHYFGASKLFGAFVTSIAAFASIMSGFGFVGGPGLVYALGATSLWITLAAPVSFGLGWFIIGKRVRLIAETRTIATLPDLAAARFKSDAVRGLLAIGLVLGVIAYLGTQVMAGGYVVSGLLGVNLETAIIIIFGITMVYTAVAGMAASILTDFFQGLIMVVAAIGVLIFALTMTGGTEGLFTTIGQKDPTLIDPLGRGTWVLVLMWFFVFALGGLGQPHLATKFYALKSHRDLKWGALISGGSYMLSSLLWIFVGYAALWLVIGGQIPALQKPDQAAIAFLGQLPTWMSALVYAGLLAAIMSTASGFIAIGTAAIVRDLPMAFGKELDISKQMWWGRVVTVLLSVFAVVLGYYGKYLVAILGALGWGYFASATLPLLAVGLNWKRATREGAIASLSVALLLNIGFLFYEKVLGMKLPYAMPSYGVSIIVALLVMIAVSLFTKGAAEDDLDPDIRAAIEA